jgi:hypothetical protein
MSGLGSNFSSPTHSGKLNVFAASYRVSTNLLLLALRKRRGAWQLPITRNTAL